MLVGGGPPPKILARARALATYRDEQALLPLDVLATAIGVRMFAPSEAPAMAD